MLIDFLQEINEKSEGKVSSVKARKSRVKVYDTIRDALGSGATYGTIFSTKAADRLYVISRPTWGAKSRSGGNTRIAKGFTPGSATPNASWPSIKSYAVRTMLKHGKTKAKRLTSKYGPGKDRPEEKRYSSAKKESTDYMEEGVKRLGRVARAKLKKAQQSGEDYKIEPDKKKKKEALQKWTSDVEDSGVAADKFTKKGKEGKWRELKNKIGMAVWKSRKVESSGAREQEPSESEKKIIQDRIDKIRKEKIAAAHAADPPKSKALKLGRPRRGKVVIPSKGVTEDTESKAKKKKEKKEEEERKKRAARGPKWAAYRKHGAAWAMSEREVNPFAVCHASTGPKKTPKYERCVKKVKAEHGIGEGKTTGQDPKATGKRVGSAVKDKLEAVRKGRVTKPGEKGYLRGGPEDILTKLKRILLKTHRKHDQPTRQRGLRATNGHGKHGAPQDLIAGYEKGMT